MGKYENMMKCAQVRSLANEKQYRNAYDVLQKINMDQITTITDLNTIADVYIQLQKYEEAKEVYLKLYDRIPTRRVLYQLVYLSVKCGELEEAEEYYSEYKELDKSSDRIILRYYIDKAKGAGRQVLIHHLQELKKEDYMEEWAYELAKLYHKEGMSEECIQECSDIILWFGEGLIVEKAMLLKHHYMDGADISSEKAILEETRNIAAELRIAAEIAARNEREQELEETEESPVSEELYAWEADSKEAEYTEETEFDSEAAYFEPEADFADERIYAESEAGFADERVYAEPETDFADERIYAEPENDLAGEAVYAEPKAELGSEAAYSEPKTDFWDEPVYVDPKYFWEDPKNISAEYVQKYEQEDVQNYVQENVQHYAQEYTQKTVQENVQKEALQEAMAEEYEEAAVDEKAGAKGNGAEEVIGNEDIFEGGASEIEEAIAGIVTDIKKERKPAHIAVTGAAPDKNVEIGKYLAKELCKQQVLPTSKIARIHAEGMDKVSLQDKAEQLTGGCIFIEEAGRLSLPSIQNLYQFVHRQRGRVVIILSDTEESLDVLLKRNRKLNNMVEYHIAI